MICTADISLFAGYKFHNVFRDGDCTVYQLKNATGQGEMRGYCPAPGIYVFYNCLRMATCYQPQVPSADWVSINHCRRGSYEFETENGYSSILGEGDMCMHDIARLRLRDSRVPPGYFDGLTVSLEVEAAQASLERLSPGLGIDLPALRDRFCSREDPFLIRPEPEIARVFDELYRVDKRIRRPYMLLKILELALLLSVCENHVPLSRFSADVVRRTREVHASLLKHPLKKRSIAELCRIFGVSSTNLRACFRALYGRSLGTFAREERLKQAAHLLLAWPDCPVGEIARQAGYENQSKFSAAFREMHHLSPLAYRRRNSDSLE